MTFSSTVAVVDLKFPTNTFETVKSAKVVGVTLRDDLKWNDHVGNITGIDRVSLIQFYCACIRSVLEYASQAFHVSLPGYLSDQIERIQKRALRIVYPELSCREALADANLMPLFEKREHLCITLFNHIIESDGQHKLARLFPVRNDTRYSLTKKRIIKTKRFQTSFITHFSNKQQM